MKKPPPEVMATWPPPNFVNPEYQGPQLAVVGIVFLALCIFVVALRLWVRVRMKRTASWDDWIMVAVLPLNIAFTACAILGTYRGWGTHVWDNRPEWATESRKLTWLCQFLFIFCHTLVKLSILVSYLRFSSSSWFRRASWVMIIITITSGIAFTMASIFACTPPQLYWASLFVSKSCQNETYRMMAFSGVNLTCELIILALPMPSLWKLRLPRRERLVLLVLMSVGLIACAASAIRTYEMYNTLELTYDLTWEAYNVYLCILIEMDLAVICASIPTLRPFVRAYLPFLGFKDSYNTRTSGATLPSHLYITRPSGHTTGLPPSADIGSREGLYPDGTELDIRGKGMLEDPNMTLDLGIDARKADSEELPSGRLSLPPEQEPQTFYRHDR